MDSKGAPQEGSSVFTSGPEARSGGPLPTSLDGKATQANRAETPGEASSSSTFQSGPKSASIHLSQAAALTDEERHGGGGSTHLEGSSHTKGHTCMDPAGGCDASKGNPVESTTGLTAEVARSICDSHGKEIHPRRNVGDDHQNSADDLPQYGTGSGSTDSLPQEAVQEGDSRLPAAKAPPRVNLLRIFDRENIRVTVVSLICGLLSGYTIALVPVYTQLYIGGTDCSLYTAKGGCESVPFADCVWHETTMQLSDGTTKSLNYCGWPSITCRAAYPNDGWVGGGGNTTLAEMQCLQDSRCTWSYSAKECQNPAGYSQQELAIFAGSMIAGNMVGAILGGPLVTSMGARLTFLVSGLYSTVACIMGHMDAYVNDFWVLATSRFVIGIFVGLITVASPLYVHENAAPMYRQKIGCMFQVFGTAGSFFGGVVGLAEGQTINFGANSDQHISGRMQGVTAGQTVISIMLILLGIFSAESKVKFKKGQEGALNQNEYSYWKMAPRLLMAVALNATFRFTGFNALANFGPKLMSSFNVAPYLGVFIIMTVNFVGALVSMPASLVVSPKTLFLSGSCFISCMCLFLCGIPVYPGVASDAVTNGCAVVGICLYIFAYEVLVGPSFYVLCQEIFPPSFRPRGNSFAQLWQFIFNLVINVCYSIAVVTFSGGPESNQHKGQSIIFMFFGGLGLVLFVYEFFCLDIWDEAAEAERKLRAAEESKRVAVPYGNGEGVTTDELHAVAPPIPRLTNEKYSSGDEGLSADLELDWNHMHTSS
ncbi:putative transport protein [Leptomonas seymouri]|uniref:Putative transport protein n=1 Tax=Leptomonas seymouri TaxID=5684 RepID=A0A0N0P3Z7_LEPSE|nr:putative transport protein [Leptomonas seymouri]|eukprot:KPI84716.1 putative transport protein [Leptomonas seymouri]